MSFVVPTVPLRTPFGKVKDPATGKLVSIKFDKDLRPVGVELDGSGKALEIDALDEVWQRFLVRQQMVVDDNQRRIAALEDSAPVSLNIAHTLVDDFMWGSLVSGQAGELSWSILGTVSSSYQTVLGRPGVLRIGTSSNGAVYALVALSESSTTTCHFHIDDTFNLLFDIRPAAVGTLANVNLRVGLVHIQQAITNPPSDGIYFEKLFADTNWFTVTRTGGVQTRTDSGIAVANNVWQILGIRRTGASTLAFSIDGVDVTPAYTNVPASTVSERSFIQLIGQNVLGQAYDIDRFLIGVTGLNRTQFEV